ncbi:c-type cytochrome [Bordetella petrii]|uniref:c-type cytochrome n=1 Tax=Bordetella petrii TaxID=94624 RepID=UPI001A96CDAB|nr:cytochrome c [Bordetella petrii]MBO1113516.1 cytochrome c [Bordetella petrii]
MPRSTYAGISPGPAAAAARPWAGALRTWRGRLSACLAVGGLSLLAACGKPDEPLAAPAQPDALPGADIQRGRERIAQYGCAGCHAIPGIRAPGARVGPPLRHLAGRAYLAGVLANTPANLVRWLRNPPAVAPNTAMPNMGLSEADARDIAAYLLTLR